MDLKYATEGVDAGSQYHKRCLGKATRCYVNMGDITRGEFFVAVSKGFPLSLAVFMDPDIPQQDCWNTVPSVYLEDVGLMAHVNTERLCQRLPSEWLPSWNLQPWGPMGLLSHGDRPPHGFARHGVLLRGRFGKNWVGCVPVKHEVPQEQIDQRWLGCRLLFFGREVRVVRDEETGRCQCEFPKPGFPSLKDICIQSLLQLPWKKQVHDLSVLPLELQEEIQKRAPPASHPGLGFEAVRMWHPNGQLCQEIPHKDGKFHGKATVWDPRGRPIAEIHFKDGKMHGNCTTMNPDLGGARTSCTRFCEGLPSGKRVLYNSGGYPKETEIFESGGCPHLILSEVRCPSVAIRFRKPKWRSYFRSTEPWGFDSWKMKAFSDCEPRTLYCAKHTEGCIHRYPHHVGSSSNKRKRKEKKATQSTKKTKIV